MKPKNIKLYISILIIIMLIVFVTLITLVNKEEILEDKTEIAEVTNPYLPNGFTYVEETNLNTGLTIEDTFGNQYVWIVVPQTLEVYKTSGLNITDFTDEDYFSIYYDLHKYSIDYRGFSHMFSMDDDKYNNSYIDKYEKTNGFNLTGLTEKQYYELKNKMLKSIYQNGGFYIGKYETGILDTYRTISSSTQLENPVIQKNAYPYNYIECSDAQKLASNMNSGEYTSSLMFGIQWDLVLKYLETNGVKKEELKSNSTNWGNYYDTLYNITNINSKYLILREYDNIEENTAYGKKSSAELCLLSTGSSELFCKMGIYDLAGNVWEWTLECGDLRSGTVCRGGTFIFNQTVVNRTDAYTYSNFYTGFRVTIY